MSLAVLFEHGGDSEIAKHQLLVHLVTEEEVRRFDVLVQYVIVVAVRQCGGTLQGYSSELVQVVPQVVFVQRSSLQVFHQLVRPMLPLEVSFSEVVDFDNHLEIEGTDGLQQFLVHIEAWIVNLQHKLLVLFSHQENLGFPRRVAQASDVPVLHTLEGKNVAIVLSTVGLCSVFSGPDGTVSRRGGGILSGCGT